MKALYLSFSDLEHSVNAVYIKGLRRSGVDLVTGQFQKYSEAPKFYRENKMGADLIIVGYDSPMLVILLKLLGAKKVVYNALCSVIERLVISRGLVPKFSLKHFYYWLQDFFACRLANLVMLESDHQVNFFRKTFWVSRNKLFRAWTGVDEEKFFYDPNVQKFPDFTVIFRGRLLPEAGAEYAVRAAKILEGKGIKFIMHSFGQELPKIQRLIQELKPQNLTLITDFLPIEKVRELMQKSHLSLGQLSAHNRLQRTIPHKAYETLALKLPYLTARNAAVMELFTERETCLAFNPADSKDLADKILWAKEHREELKGIAENGYKLYQERLRPVILAKDLLDKQDRM